MANIYCSGKLTSLIGSLAKAKEAEPSVEKLDSWNAHLFMLGGKKCIVFVNKATCYTCVRLGVAKRDLADLSGFFQACLLQQLKANQLLEMPFLDRWIKPPSEHKFYSTDNDKVLIGTINNLVPIFGHIFEKYKTLSTDLEVRIGVFANDYLTGALNYETPLRAIARLADAGIPVPPQPVPNPFGIPEGPQNPEFLVAEPLSEIVRVGAEKLLREYCEFKIPKEYRDQIRMELQFEGDCAILIEKRPDWEGGPDWSAMPIVRFRYNYKTARWAAYWCDSLEKWHLCDDLGVHESLEELIELVDEDNSGRFWG